MTQEIVYYDASGKVINIGEWKYMLYDDFDENQKPIQKEANPIPDGAITQMKEIGTLPDGGKYVLD